MAETPKGFGGRAVAESVTGSPPEREALPQGFGGAGEPPSAPPVSVAVLDPEPEDAPKGKPKKAG